MASDFVRVKDPGTGHEVTVTAVFAEAFKLTPLEGKAALDNNGRPLPGKPHVDLPKADQSAGGGDGDPETPPPSASTTSGQTAGKAATK